MRDSHQIEEMDLLVIGGGITGAGIAQDAAARGLKTVLVEKGDFASGTSSRSSKQIHGGLRYLEHFSLGLMKESISERHTLTRLAPGLVRWTPFLIPYFRGKEKRWRTSLGLWLYDNLARTPAGLRHRVLNASEILGYAPELRRDGLLGGAHFYDCLTDDARLVLSLALDAQSRGALVCNHVAVEASIREHGKTAGALVRDMLSGQSWTIRARQVVVATGPWTDRTLDLLGEAADHERIRPAKGVHIVLPRSRLNLNHVVLIPSVRDRRFLFVIPWYEGIVVGTTDTEYHQAPDEVRPERADVNYILDAMNWSFPEARIAAGDLVCSYAGIRPLINVPGKETADVPREYKLFETEGGVISVAGGKLTTYRRMAKAVVDRVVRRLKSTNKDLLVMPCWTHRIPLGHPPEDEFNPFKQTDLPEDIRNHLIADYGVWTEQVVSFLQSNSSLSRRMVPELPYILAEAYYAVTYEKARTLEDILVRRTRVALLDPARGRGCAREVATLVAAELNWSAEDIERQIELYERAIKTRFCGPEDLID
jgi:glycerol-3-phosphate dehydrogenase